MTGPQMTQVLRVIKGTPLPEELAALTVVLLAAHDTGPVTPPAPSGWRDLARRHALCRPLTTGPQGWRESRWTYGGLL
ncbi:acyl-CoA carboxylase subunit epsilon [Sphaerisporangium sp. NPDC051011]|uniref:acyl-CoA carboxylase subunit epsilon n=1 Tax=Sphaerisporangium sp. NPDC051011 TaxID=3155792 RepID=UPI0034099E1C